LGKLAILFINNILPILLIAGIGFLAGKYLNIQARTLSRVIFYIFSPCLIFNLLVNSQLGGEDILRMAGFTCAVVLSMVVISYLFGKAMKLNREMIAALVLTTMALNAGNYGLSLNLFAFGEKGLAQASVFFVTTALLTYSVGVLVASMGNEKFMKAILNLFKVPAIYALTLAIVFIWREWALPTPLDRTITILGDASIPTMLILLGLQFQSNQRSYQVPALIAANGLRLVGGAVLGLLLAGLLGLQGVAYQAGVVEAATPTAVLSTVLSTEYDIEPAFVTTVVFSTTLLSPLTLTPLLAYLGA
jgi:predicted permease